MKDVEYYEIRRPEPDANPHDRSNRLWTRVALLAAFAIVMWWCVGPLVGRESVRSATNARTAGCGMAALGALNLVFAACVSALVAWLWCGLIRVISNCDRERE